MTLFGLVPTVYAQNTDKLDSLLTTLVREIIEPGLMLLTALAVVYFLYGVFVFIKDSSSDQGVTTGRRHILWGIIGLFIIVSAWGIVSFICTTVACSSARP
jgi:hypothetical protein